MTDALARRGPVRIVCALVLLLSCASVRGDSWGRGPHRGANVGLWLTTSDLKVLRSWGADHVRAQMLPKNMPVTEADGDVTFTHDAWQRLDAFVARAREAGLRVVLDLHAHGLFFPDAYWTDDARRAWADPRQRARFAQVWRHIAERYGQDRTTVLGYDILNEPHPPRGDSGLRAWNEVAAQVVRSIRSVDTHHTIIVECPSYANPAGMAGLEPVADGNVVYSFHMYMPHEFTEQGTRPQWPFGQRYPGIVGLGWSEKRPTRIDRQWLEHAVAPARDFQRRTGCRIWVGEFSARRDAPDGSACRYLKDVLDMFEREGWSWAYHAFRESQTWDLERCAQSGPQKRGPSTPRLELLKRCYRGEGVAAQQDVQTNAR